MSFSFRNSIYINSTLFLPRPAIPFDCVWTIPYLTPQLFAEFFKILPILWLSYLGWRYHAYYFFLLLVIEWSPVFDRSSI